MAKNSTKDKQMAKYLKDHNITRDSGICVICGGVVKNKNVEAHIGMHARGGNN